METDLGKLAVVSSFFMMSYSMISRCMNNILYIPDPITNLLYGIAVGRHGLALIKPHYSLSKVILVSAARIILCLQTMSISFSLPKNYFSKSWKDIFIIVVLGGFLKCFFIFLLLIGFGMKNIANCWAIASSLTPTDPILCFAIVKGKFAKKHIHRKLRTLIAAESGINDGFGIFVLNISVEVLKYYAQIDSKEIKGSLQHQGILIRLKRIYISFEPFYRFFVGTFLKKIIFSSAVGYFIGYITQKTTKYCSKHNLVRMEALSTHPFILSFFALGLMECFGGSELICIFFTGLALNSDDWYSNKRATNLASEILESLLSNMFFIFIGAILDFRRITWFNFIISILIIVFARTTIVLGIYKAISVIKTFKEALFVGWFGPIGVGAIYYCIMYDSAMNTLTVELVTCVVVMSIFIHGLSVPMYCFINMAYNRIRSIFENDADLIDP